jgi:hypothetical protein
MQLDRSSVIEIAKLLDKDGQLGLVKAAQDATVPDPTRERGIILEILQSAAQASSIVLAIRFLVSEVNAILQEIETEAKDGVEILGKLEEVLRTRYLVPAQKNKAKIQAMLNAIVEHVKSKLGK